MSYINSYLLDDALEIPKLAPDITKMYEIFKLLLSESEQVDKHCATKEFYMSRTYVILQGDIFKKSFCFYGFGETWEQKHSPYEYK